MEKAFASARRRLAVRGGQALCALAFIAAFELGARALGVLDPCARPDPYLGLAGTSPLFRRESIEGLEIYRCAPNKRAQYRDERFLAAKPAGSFRIFCLGGSSVASQSLPGNATFPGLLRIGLQAVRGDARVEVVNAGGGGVGSQQILEVAREALERSPDLFVVYPEAGERRYVPPNPEGEQIERDAKSPWSVAARRCLSRSRLYACVRDGVAALRRKPAHDRPSPFMAAAHWAAARDFSEDTFSRVLEFKHDRVPPVFKAHTSTRDVERVLDRFEENMVSLVALCDEAHVPVLFVAPVRNLRVDFYLRFRVEPDEILPGHTDAWRAAYEKGLCAKRRGDLVEAVALLRDVRGHLAVDRDHALAFYLGECLEGLGRAAEARAEYERFFVSQPMRMRLRSASARSRAAFLDPYPALCAASSRGIPDETLFLDSNHPSPAANAVIAQQIVRSVLERGWLGPSLSVSDAEKARAAIASSTRSVVLPAARTLQQAVYRRDFRAAVDAAKDAPPTNYIERMYLGLAQTRVGDLEGARATWEELRREFKESGKSAKATPAIVSDADMARLAFDEDLLSEF